VIAELKKYGREDIMVVVEESFRQDYQFLFDAGAAVFGPGTKSAMLL
jgi:methylmalonyl-CoA mutase cobalamin-binding domain/chain